ncbi:HD domain-containing phosphohydrolase [Natronincola ferrireducens]|uniref:HDIG domain-containing protein n=1 Tax=Natronincola ferrireducens TaxID=393762 RepID=A0A1G8XNG4_9FIRM|nr:transporter substrate-binding domain-containing protein [Natronincola ferrireducens]SDJ91704.1 HDIG domain-containing protein [Natronincola ferrireducens]
MGKRTKLVSLLYIIITIGFFTWFIMVMIPHLKYNLSSFDKEYLQYYSDKFVFVGDEEYPPFSFNMNSMTKGYEADIIRAFKEELNIDLTYKQMNWSEAIEALERGEISVITGMQITEERKEKYLFSDPYLVTTQAIVAPRELGDVSVEDLQYLRIIAQKNSITHDIALENNAGEIIIAKDPLEAMELLINGEGDVWIENNMTALYYLRLYNENHSYNIKILEETTGHYAMALSKDNSMLADIINRVIYTLHKKGTIGILDNKWFGIVGHRPFQEIPRYFYITFFSYILLTCMFLFYLWNTTLHYQLNKKTNDLKKTNHLLQEERENIANLLEGIATAFATAIDYRDAYTGNHSKRVARLSIKTAEEMGLSQKDVFDTYVGALLHDVGKVGIPDNILNKTGPLTPEEYNIIKQHPVIGAKILDVIKSYDTIRNAVYYHHERWDGGVNTPFPSYLGTVKEEEIPLAARIIAVADAFDAMTTDRPYRKALDLSEAIKRIEIDSGKQFDPNVVTSFLKIIALEEGEAII